MIGCSFFPKNLKEMKNIKQIIVIRKDLKMRRGKECSQSAHASMKGILKDIDFSTQHSDGTYHATINIDMNTYRWLSDCFTKICVTVNSEQELIDVYNKAKEMGVNCAMIEDSGKTEFNGIVTKTCCSIGPDTDEKLKLITGHLPLY